MSDHMFCPHCGEEQDQSEAREWHGLQHADEVDVDCDSCDSPITVKANMAYEVCKRED